MHYLSANCIIPVRGKLRYNSVLAVEDDGTIEGIYDKNELKTPFNEIIHYKGILCPGFVNTHCHLELSWAKGMLSVGGGLDLFLRQLENLKKSVSEVTIQKAIEEAALEMGKSGIVATADIANGASTLNFKNNSKHYFQTFVEVFGSNPSHAAVVFEKALILKAQFGEKSDSNAVSVVPHSTYSVSDELFRLVAELEKDNRLSFHHQENTDENLFFKNGSGPIAARRKAFNPDLPHYEGSGKRPMETIAGYFRPDQNLLLVHNTVSEEQDIDFVQQYFIDAYWCLCPNANLYIEKRLPDIDIFRSKNCKITLGTDSLASNHQLSIFEEIKTIQQHFPHIPLAELLNWGSLNGAEFLGLGNKLGSFEQGKSPGVVLIENIDLPALKLKPESTSRLIIAANYESNIK
ncbi:MAG: amidohydrolase family protein [Lentimicrobiaceae bacterium]|jgi:cytosine/adenosine deaminase-related metal-dependent hydrolase